MRQLAVTARELGFQAALFPKVPKAQDDQVLQIFPNFIRNDKKFIHGDKLELYSWIFFLHREHPIPPTGFKATLSSTYSYAKVDSMSQMRQPDGTLTSE